MKFISYGLLIIHLLSSCVSADSTAARFTGKEERQSTPEANEKVCRVTKVIDGDTFWVEDAGSKYKVRLIGVDAPETRNSRWKQKGALAAEAKAFVRQLIDDQSVRLVFDVQRNDRYQRVLAYVYLMDGTFLNAELLKAGYAVVDTYPPNVKHVERFTELQKAARENRVGVWAEEHIN